MHDLTNLGQRGQLFIFLFCMQILCNVRMQIRRSLANFTGIQVKVNLALARSFEPHLSRYKKMDFNTPSVALCTLGAVDWDNANMCLMGVLTVATRLYSCHEDWAAACGFRYHPPNYM
jgi:hypothetical protein